MDPEAPERIYERIAAYGLPALAAREGEKVTLRHSGERAATVRGGGARLHSPAARASPRILREVREGRHAPGGGRVGAGPAPDAGRGPVRALARAGRVVRARDPIPPLGARATPPGRHRARAACMPQC